MNTYFSIFAILIVLTASFAYLNHKFIKMPPAIGLMLISVVASLLLILTGKLFPDIFKYGVNIIETIDFPGFLLGSILSFMLFAGSINIKIDVLNVEKFPILIFSTISVLLSSLLIGIASFYLLLLFGIEVKFINCLLFGVLISPTDPLAVLGILRASGISKSLEMKLSGESLFNDGISIVAFLTIMQLIKEPLQFNWYDVAFLFLRQAIGGIGFGLVIGFIGLKLIAGINNYKVEIMITLAIVMGGYSVANAINISGPLAMVVAGIIIGNQKQKFPIRSNTYLINFWEIIDETLNSLLFVLMGFEILAIKVSPLFFVLGLITIIITLLSRFASIYLPAQLLRFKEKITNHTILILTWGGLRGGLSFALALSLKPDMNKDLWVTVTYIVVSFSILVQGLTIGKLANKPINNSKINLT